MIPKNVTNANPWIQTVGMSRSIHLNWANPSVIWLSCLKPTLTSGQYTTSTTPMQFSTTVATQILSTLPQVVESTFQTFNWRAGQNSCWKQCNLQECVPHQTYSTLGHFSRRPVSLLIIIIIMINLIKGKNTKAAPSCKGLRTILKIGRNSDKWMKGQYIVIK